YTSESSLRNFNKFIFLAYKAKNTVIALAMASIFNAEKKKKKKIKSPNHFRLGICMAKYMDENHVSRLTKVISCKRKEG
ncbi:MAG: hypothetical protein KDC34_17100, partial [Saprospiraceae bacterium]|nr:hypothetical protein [Saprospiraceae bacterium]